MSPKQRFNITLEPWHIEMLRLLEAETGASASELIRRAVTAYLIERAGGIPVLKAELAKRQSLRKAKKSRRGGK